MSSDTSSVSDAIDALSTPLRLIGTSGSEMDSEAFTFWTANVIYTIGWICLFYLLCWHWRTRMTGYPPSSKDHENDVYWCARNIIGIIMSAMISVIAVPVGFAFCFNLWNAWDGRFCGTNEVGTCHIPDSPWQDSACVSANWFGQPIAFAGQLFITFTFADTIISCAHKLATPDFIVHHIAFLTAGFIVRSNCMLPFNASVLLAMEISTPSLNYMLLVRHRGNAYTTAVQIHGSIFFLLFVVFRLLFNTYGTYILIADRDYAIPEGVPVWQKWFLFIAILAGAVLQYFWFVGAIAMKFGKLFVEMVQDFKGRKSNGNGANDGEAYSRMKP